MLNFEVIGNLGDDAIVRTENGKQFVTFNVGENRKYTDASGNEHEETYWVSCTLNGDGGALLPYLRKGKLVYISGRGSTRVYSSAKLRTMVAGVNIQVNRIELLGGENNSAPKFLIDEDGLMYRTVQLTFIDINEQVKLADKVKKGLKLCDNKSNWYMIDKKFQVTKLPNNESNT